MANADDPVGIVRRFLEHYRQEWGLATLEETIDRVLFEWSDEGAQQRIADALAANVAEKGATRLMTDLWEVDPEVPLK